MNVDHYMERINDNVRFACEEIAAAAREISRPSYLLRPTINLDGNAWCALYGENLQDGVAGFGKTPALAMTDFDEQWCRGGGV